MLAEMTNDIEFGHQNVQPGLAYVFAASKNGKLAEFTNMLKGVVRRMNLVGHEMTDRGKSARRWVPSSGRRTRAMSCWSTFGRPNTRGASARSLICGVTTTAYHDKGFDIVAISLDRRSVRCGSFCQGKGNPLDHRRGRWQAESHGQLLRRDEGTHEGLGGQGRQSGGGRYCGRCVAVWNWRSSSGRRGRGRPRSFKRGY